MHLSSEDRDRLLKFYQDGLAAYGSTDARATQWSDASGQRRRFDVLLNVMEDADGEAPSLLDAGCGLGELYKATLEKKIALSYTGIDIVPDYIDLARIRFPQARFEYKDIMDMSEQFDYVVASGALTFKVKDNDAYYREMIQKMHGMAKKAVAFNMLNRVAHVNDDTYASYEPKEIADFCGTLGGRVETILGYLPQDFTIYIYKD
jgi:SAM-dependent methyltransferase